MISLDNAKRLGELGIKCRIVHDGIMRVDPNTGLARKVGTLYHLEQLLEEVEKRGYGYIKLERGAVNDGPTWFFHCYDYSANARGNIDVGPEKWTDPPITHPEDAVARALITILEEE